MVVGLGNPGEEYIGTRHNLGFQVVDSLAESLKVDFRKKKFGGVFGSVEYEDKKLILFKPWLYMNRSGQAVATAAGFYKLELENLLVVTDDLALEPGVIRVRMKGSSGGHNGLGDIIEKLGTAEFGRLRIGIGPSRGDDVGYVLGRPSEDEKPLLDDAVDAAGKAVFCWIKNGIEMTMNRFN
jgi:PTH1 family peptidyl-tRNA hydrolase